MPKLNTIHLPSRLQEHIEKMERGEEVEAKKDKTLLNKAQQQALKDALLKQQQLKKKHKRPKTQADKDKIGWKEIREVRLEIYKIALADISDNLVDIYEKELSDTEVKAARVFLDAYFNAKEGTNKWSAGNIALRRNGFNRIDGQSYSYSNKRDREVNEMEDSLRERMEDDLSTEEKEQLELSREYDKAVAKRRK
jgi:hypothetical protein